MRSSIFRNEIGDSAAAAIESFLQLTAVDAPLMTADLRLAAAARDHCEVVIV